MREALALWSVLVPLMAVADVLAPSEAWRTSFWVSAFYLGTGGTILLLIRPHRLAIAAVGFIGGLFLLVYQMVWWFASIADGIPFTGNVGLYPFGLTTDWTSWFAILFLGAFLLGFSLAELASWSEEEALKRPPSGGCSDRDHPGV